MSRKQKILIIDDEIDICLLLQEYLTQHGFNVSTVNSGTGALNLLEREAFDLIITDFRLGDIDGLELIIRIQDKNVPVIMITGYSDIKIAVRIIKLGAYDYVTKPLYPDEILLTVQNALAERAAGSKTQLKHDFIVGESKEMSDVPPEIVSDAHIWDSSKMVSDALALSLKDSAHVAEAAAILRVLREVNNNRTKAAKVLNIDRKTLYNKMKLLKIPE